MTETETSLRNRVVKKAVAWVAAADAFTKEHGKPRRFTESQVAADELRAAVREFLEYRMYK